MNDFQHLTKSAIFKGMGYSPGFLLKIGRFRTIRNSLQIFLYEPESSFKYICKHIGGVSGSFERFPVLTKSPIFKTMGYSPGFLLKIGRFRTIRNLPQIFTKKCKSSWKSIWKHIGGVSGRLERFPALIQIHHFQKRWAIAQAFCSKSPDFGPFGTYPKSSPKSPKVFGNPFGIPLEAFQEVSNDFQHLTKPTIFKTMGYSPGFLLEIGRFRALRNSLQIFLYVPESSFKYICKHIGGVSGSFERFPALNQIRHFQNHGL